MTQEAPQDPEIVTALDVVDTLEELVGAGRRLPFTSNVVVNEEDVLELVDRIRLSLPDDLRSARHTLDERDRLLERAARDSQDTGVRAQEEAARLLREAEARAAQLVDEHAIVIAAQERARATIADAEQRAAADRAAADAYARDVMGRLEDQLDRWLATVREGMQSLPGVSAAPRARRARR